MLVTSIAVLGFAAHGCGRVDKDDATGGTAGAGGTGAGANSGGGASGDAGRGGGGPKGGGSNGEGGSGGDCLPGYEPDRSGACVDIDECATETHACDPATECKNIDGGYICGDCPPGHTGGGVNGCVDIVDCVTPSPCQNDGECAELPAGGYTCTCDPRFTGTHCEFQRFKGLGLLRDGINSRAYAISGDGTTVVGASADAKNIDRAVRSINGGPLQGIASPGEACVAVGVSVDATVIAGTCYGNPTLRRESRPFKYSASEGATFPTIAPVGQGNVAALSGNGAVMVGSGSRNSGSGSLPDATSHAARFTSAGGELLPALYNYGESLATAVNDDGTLLVGRSTDSSAHFLRTVPFEWTEAAGILELPMASNWLRAIPRAISRDGAVYVGHADASLGGQAVSKAARWSNGELRDYGPGRLLATNHDGTISVGASNDAIAQIWNGSTAEPLTQAIGATSDLDGWTLTEATGISDDGKVVCGNGVHDGVEEAWVAHLP